jgi:Transposase DDE domain/Transposase domain (DUF772)
MQLTSRTALLQFAHVCQQELFPMLEAVLDGVSDQLELVVSIVSLVPLGKLLNASRAGRGRPAKDRTALATAFIAKAVLGLPTTRDLIDRLKVDRGLRQLCGWRSEGGIPHESKFSRAFAEFAANQLPQRLHEAMIEHTQKDRLIGHIARDSTAINGREQIPEAVREEKRQKRKGRQRKPSAHGKRGRPKGSVTLKAKKKKVKASQRESRLERQPHQSLEAMLAELPTQCDIGAKKTKNGENQYWTGFKLHLDVADGQIPISAILTSASVHDSQVAIPLMTLTGKRVDYLYDLMDSAYDANHIHAHSRKLNHVAIIAPHPRRGSKQPSQLPKVFPATVAPEMTWAQKERFKERTMVERVYSRLKDEFGANQVRVRGAAKVMAHLMFGVLALAVDQWLRILK